MKQKIIFLLSILLCFSIVAMEKNLATYIGQKVPPTIVEEILNFNKKVFNDNDLVMVKRSDKTYCYALYKNGPCTLKINNEKKFYIGFHLHVGFNEDGKRHLKHFENSIVWAIPSSVKNSLLKHITE